MARCTQRRHEVVKALGALCFRYLLSRPGSHGRWSLSTCVTGEATGIRKDGNWVSGTHSYSTTFYFKLLMPRQVLEYSPNRKVTKQFISVVVSVYLSFIFSEYVVHRI